MREAWVKFWHATWPWNCDTRRDEMATNDKNGLNTDRDMAYSSTYTLHPPPSPSPQTGPPCQWMRPYMYMYCTSHLQNALLEYKVSKAIDEVTYLMHVTYSTSIKQQTLCESGFSWVYMSRYTNISDRWDILLFNRRRLKKKTLSKIYLQ